MFAWRAAPVLGIGIWHLSQTAPFRFDCPPQEQLRSHRSWMRSRRYSNLNDVDAGSEVYSHNVSGTHSVKSRGMRDSIAEGDNEGMSPPIESHSSARILPTGLLPGAVERPSLGLGDIGLNSPHGLQPVTTNPSSRNSVLGGVGGSSIKSVKADADPDPPQNPAARQKSLRWGPEEVKEFEGTPAVGAGGGVSSAPATGRPEDPSLVPDASHLSEGSGGAARVNGQPVRSSWAHPGEPAPANVVRPVDPVKTAWKSGEGEQLQ